MEYNSSSSRGRSAFAARHFRVKCYRLDDVTFFNLPSERERARTAVCGYSTFFIKLSEAVFENEKRFNSLLNL